jgi:hypothetical protein
MKQFRRSMVSSLALSLLLVGCAVDDQDGDSARFGPTVVGEEIAITLQSPAYTAQSGQLELVWEHELVYKGATYIAPHFSSFSLPEGAYLIVRTPDTSRSRTYAGEGKPGWGALGFWGLYMPGDRAVLELYSSTSLDAGAVRLDMFARGLDIWLEPLPGENSGESDIEKAICGADDSLNAKCYESSEPQAYDKARAVTRLMINGSGACTGWLVGSEGHVMTNNHCIGTAGDAANTSFDFMAEGSTCSTNCNSWGGCPGTVAADASTLIRTSVNLDYTLVLLPSNVSSTYGYLQMRENGGVLGERIYIPQHPAAWGKRIAMNDGANPATITSLSAPPCNGTGYNDVGYYADTQGGSSGSPVLGYSDHAVVALHHCANCPNRGVPINLVINDLGSSLPSDAVAYACTPAPIANAGPDQTVCLGDSATIGPAARADTTYSWSTGDTSAQITVSPAAATTYTVTATTSCGSATDSVTVYVDDGSGGGLSDDFESGAGTWTTTGLWHLTDSSSCASPGYASATHAMYYGQDSSCNYNTGAATTGSLTSSLITGINTNSALSFQYFRQVESYSGSYDQTFVEVSNNGTSWSTVWSRDSSNPSENAWTASGPISLASFAGQNIQIRFRFDSRDSVSNAFTGWFVDDVVVSGQSSCGGGGGGNTAPVVSISSPSEGGVFSRKQTITFTGSASDAEDGDISGDLTWTSDLAGVIGTGASFGTKLGAGVHTITATATDTGDASGSASVTIEVTRN